MDTYERIKEICDKKKLSIRQLEIRCSIANGTIRKWRDGRIPSSESLFKVAECLGVTQEYLMGVQENEQRKGYYLNEKTAELAQEMYEDEDLRALFHMKRNMNPDKFKVHMETMKQLYRIEHPEDESIS